MGGQSHKACLARAPWPQVQLKYMVQLLQCGSEQAKGATARQDHIPGLPQQPRELPHQGVPLSGRHGHGTLGGGASSAARRLSMMERKSLPGRKSSQGTTGRHASAAGNRALGHANESKRGGAGAGLGGAVSPRLWVRWRPGLPVPYLGPLYSPALRSVGLSLGFRRAYRASEETLTRLQTGQGSQV